MIRARQSGHPGDFVIRRQLTFVAILMPEKTCRTRSLPQRQYDSCQRGEGGKVITKVEAAWNEAWVGGEQVRFIRFDGDRLFIESPPMPHPNLAGKVVRVIVIWERET